MPESLLLFHSEETANSEIVITEAYEKNVQSHTESSWKRVRGKHGRRGAHWATGYWCVSHVGAITSPLTLFCRKDHIPHVHACAAYLSPPGRVPA